MNSYYDVIVLGGGAAGLFCAAIAGKRGRRVLVLEVSNKFGKKILMSGGGRCNFTNLDIRPEHFICNNPHFVKSALSQYTQWDFISLVSEYQIPYHEKGDGQLFCDRSSKEILNLLLAECDLGDVQRYLDCTVSNVDFADGQYCIQSSQGQFSCQSLVVATGGLSIPTLGGSTGFAYDIAKQFGLTINKTEPSLVPMTLTGQWHELANQLLGVALPVTVSVPSQSFTQNMLFTHRGISGPAILQLSNYWYLGEPIIIDLLPHLDAYKSLIAFKQSQPRQTLTSWLSKQMPKSAASAFQSLWWPEKMNVSIHDCKNTELERIAHQLSSWQLTPSGTEGYRTAEVTRGGVDVSNISSKTMQVKHQSGLFFIGEALDVTGHLGGYNFQWAWSSGYVAGINA